MLPVHTHEMCQVFEKYTSHLPKTVKLTAVSLWILPRRNTARDITEKWLPGFRVWSVCFCWTFPSLIFTLVLTDSWPSWKETLLVSDCSGGVYFNKHSLHTWVLRLHFKGIKQKQRRPQRSLNHPWFLTSTHLMSCCCCKRTVILFLRLFQMGYSLCWKLYLLARVSLHIDHQIMSRCWEIPRSAHTLYILLEPLSHTVQGKW